MPLLQRDTRRRSGFAPDPWEIIHKVRELGPADVTRDDFRDSLITASLPNDDGALEFEVSFYGCNLGRNCDRILLTLRLQHEEWAEEPPPADVFADWIGQKLIGRAWLDGENRAVLDHPVVIGPGLPAETLAGTIEAWSTAMPEFAEHIDFPGK